jgi:hypothetical protein
MADTLVLLFLASFLAWLIVRASADNVSFAIGMT